MDAELFHVLLKAIKKLGLDWSSPEEPSRSHLDKWFLPGQSPSSAILSFFAQRTGNFFLELKDADFPI